MGKGEFVLACRESSPSLEVAEVTLVDVATAARSPSFRFPWWSAGPGSTDRAPRAGK